jgi:hypothetical protein
MGGWLEGICAPRGKPRGGGEGMDEWMGWMNGWVDGWMLDSMSTSGSWSDSHPCIQPSNLDVRFREMTFAAGVIGRAG